MLHDAILIDAENRTIKPVKMDDEKEALPQFYGFLKCDVIDAVRFESRDNTGWVDDEGLLKGAQDFFYLPSFYPQPIAERMLITGTGWNDEGDFLQDVTIKIDDLEKDIRWFTIYELREWLKTDEAAHLR